jgi:transcriptional regulator with XRE-family HTH domain
MEELDRPIGERIAIYRRRRNVSQTVLAGLIGRSESWLSQVERGTRSVDRLSVLIDIAKVLHVDVAVLTGQPFSLGPNGGPELDRLGEIRTALLDARLITDTTSEPEMSVPDLREAAHEVHAVYQAARYRHAAGMVAALVRRGEKAVATTTADTQRQALVALSEIYSATAAILSRVGETELASLAADRAIAVARQAGREDMAKMALYRLAQACLRAGRPEDAYRLATIAAHELEVAPGRFNPLASLHGAFLLTAAIAAARNDDRREYLRQLRQATAIADEVGEDHNEYWTAFGPTNVRLHATSAAVEIGDPDDAIRQGETVDPALFGDHLAGRRSQVHVDLAWAYGQRRNDPATVLSLLEAERHAPEALRFNVTARELIRECLRRERRTAVPHLRGLAQRTGLLV